MNYQIYKLTPKEHLRCLGMAAGLSFLCIRAKICGMTSFHAKLSSDLVQVFYLLRSKLLGTTQHSGLV